LRQVVLDVKVLSAWALCAHVQASEHRHTGRTVTNPGFRVTNRWLAGLVEYILIQGADLHHLTDASSFYQACVCLKAHVAVVFHSLDVGLSIVSGRAASTNGLAYPIFALADVLLLIGHRYADKKSPTPDDLILRLTNHHHGESHVMASLRVRCKFRSRGNLGHTVRGSPAGDG